MINFKRFLSSRGFTLLELLVVISIIGILVAMGAASYSTAQIKGRDAKRRGDMQNWGAALEQYYSANTSKYPISATCAMGGTSTTYLPGGIPTDPKGGSSYTYSAACDTSSAGADYCLCAHLESGSGGNASGNGDHTCNTFSANGAYFCVKSQQ